MEKSSRPTRPGNSHVRYWIVAMLFLLTTINFADRSAMSIAGPALKGELGITSTELGYIFSAFAWSYVVAQIPGGALLDRFGSRKMYIFAILGWSTCTFASGFASYLAPGSAVIALFILRLALGAAEAPSFPANARLVAAWFPDRERGTASAIFNTAQYAALIFFAPLMGWIVDTYSWHYVFFVMGSVGFVGALIFATVVHAPARHPRITRTEFDFIEANGAQVQLDAAATAPKQPFSWNIVGQLLTNRMLMGIYIGQYCITALTFFFSTWFPVYLVQGRGLSYTAAGFGAAIPAIAGVVGGVIGGVLSDRLIASGKSVTFARKLPVVLGMACATSIVLCNFTDNLTLVIGLMALSFFGKGVGALGWAIMSDAAPRAVTGLAAGIFNMFGNIAGITTPIVIGYILDATGSFDLALVFVAAHSIMAIVSYLFIVGPIKRFTVTLPEQKASESPLPSAKHA
ncbi:MFS transporter [Sphingobium yanoikuyae]|uniref:MFS transporter n=1 Tax=Sphingobium yanoikuyae TaxID=13690 RepID=UPI0022DE62FA|nr:MFS transporter [Sphingobium yanoikuyae]WBQ18312.1 MFS transporter [Sphingobium yanoikuyae]